MFNLKSKELGHFDVAVCGGGIAGASAAISAARAGASVVLIERGGSLGGTLTEGFMPLILDADNKGGIVAELYNFLNAHDMTLERRGMRFDENGKKIPGRMIDTEGCKYFFDKTATDLRVKILFYSQVAGVNMNGDAIENILVVTECGNYSLDADVYIDATGNGLLSELAGCEWDCGDPHEGHPSPTSHGLCAVGMPADCYGTDSADDKTKYNDFLVENGIRISAEQASVKMLPSTQTWCFGINFQYGVRPDDIESVTRATLEGRRENFETIEAHKKLDGYEKLSTVFTSAHLGIREGRRVYGEYRLTDDDILSGARFDDGICLVRFGVDLHKLKKNDTTDCQRGYRTKPYHIPYRCLLPKGVTNLMLAGRCISGDFYPHASYRVMGNMAATGEAAGFAAANSAKAGISPKSFDGSLVRAYMESLGYEL